MKNFTPRLLPVLGAVALAIYGLGFWNCEKEGVVGIPNYEVYQQIGIEHNNGLNYILEQLKKTDLSTQTRKDIFDIIERATKEFVVRTFDSNDETLLIMNPQIAKAFDRVIECGGESKGANPALYDDEMSASLSDMQINLLDELGKIMSDGDNELPSLKKRILALEQRAANRLTEGEYPVIFSATSVARYSLEYWNKNADEWIELFRKNAASPEPIIELQLHRYGEGNGRGRLDQPMLPPNSPGGGGGGFSWTQLAWVDVGAAGGAAVGALGANLFFGPGTVAYGTAVVGAAAVASGANAGYQLHQYFSGAQARPSNPEDGPQ